MGLRHCPSAPAICALLLTCTSVLGATPQGTATQQRLDELLAELGEAQHEQDHARLQALYSELARLQPRKPEFQRGLGLACYLQGEFEPAIVALERASSLDSDLPGTQLYLGISYYRMNRFSEALVQLDQAPEFRANDPMARYWVGATYRALGRMPEAISSLEAAQAGAKTNLDVLQMLTRSYSEHSAEWFRRLLTAAATSPPARLLKAEELAMDGAEEAALQELEEALAEAPNLIGLHRARGEILWSQQQHEEGAAEFRLELEIDPFSVESHIRLGAFLLDNGDPASALGHLRLSQRFAPSDERVVTLLDQALRAGVAALDPFGNAHDTSPSAELSIDAAHLAYRRGEAERASVLLQRVLEVQGESVEVRRLLARCQIAEGRIEEAVEHLQRILASRTDDPETLYALGKIYDRLASQSAAKLFRLNPRSSEARILRGESFERGPRYEFARALAEFREARNISPNDPGSHHAIGRVLYKLKRFDEAIPNLQAALALNPSHAMANYLLGKIRLLQGQRAAAIDSLHAAVHARPDLAAAQRDLARALVLEGHHEEGIRIYQTLLESGPEDASLHALLAAAYRRAGRMEEAKAQAEKARLLSAR